MFLPGYPAIATPSTWLPLTGWAAVIPTRWVSYLPHRQSHTFAFLSRYPLFTTVLFIFNVVFKKASGSSKMTSPPFTLDLPTVLSIAFSLSFMPLAYYLANRYLPSKPLRNRILFMWHAYDALTHIFIEGSFLYECFFSYKPIAAIHSIEPSFLNRPDRIYGPAYGSGPTARLWQEYAKADRRWAGADVTVVSLELLTVFLGGPAAIYICWLLYKSANASGRTASAVRGSSKAILWLTATALATAELYGGFMTFAPEWLTGSSQLATEDPVYLWLYLFFFNTLWVFVPGWVLLEARKELLSVFGAAEGKVGSERSPRSERAERTERMKRH